MLKKLDINNIRKIPTIFAFQDLKNLSLKSNISDMNNRILKICYAVFLAVIFVCIVLLGIQDVRMGMDTTADKAILALYVVLALYALWRIIGLVKEIRR